MKQRLPVIILFFFSFACSSPSPKDRPTTQTASVEKSQNGYTWTQLLDSASWDKSYNFQMFSLRDTLWVFHPDGTWFSPDGNHWDKSPLPNALFNLAFLDYIPFKDAVYGLGRFEGNIERFEFKPEIYRTADLRQWDTLSRNSNLPERFFYHPFVFEDKIWIIGGEDRNVKFADIWNSADGIHWVKQRDHLPFGKTSGGQVVELNGTLFLLNNDVWSSTDGLNWEQVAREIVPGVSLFGYAAVAFDGRIWLLGCNRNGQFTSQVLVSSDGKNWEEQQAPWSPRGGIAACVFRDKVFMTGGKYGGTPDHVEFRYSNDLWALEKK